MKKFILVSGIMFLIQPILQAQKWDLGNNRQPARIVQFTPDNKYLVAGGFLKIWNMNNGEMMYNFTKEGDEFTSDLAIDSDISNDGRYLAVVKTGRLDIIDLRGRTLAGRINGTKLVATAISPDNKTLVYTKSYGEMGFYNIPAGQRLSLHKLGRFKPTRMTWSDSGKFIAIGGRDDRIILFDVEKRVVVSTVSLGSNFVWDIEFSTDSKYIGIAMKDGSIKIIDTSTGNIEKSWSAHPGSVFAIAFHPSGRFLVSGGADNNIRIWELPSGNPVASWKAHTRAVLALAISTDGTMLASGSQNGPMMGVNDTRVWDLTNRGIGSAIVSQELAYIRPVLTDLTANTITDQKRMALIIGNGIYQSGGTLANPENDANDIGASLQQLGFDVMLYNNLNQEDFKKAIDEFGLRLEEYDVGLFYYAGHGIQVKGNNYLIPVDANLRSENDVEYDCVNTGRLLAKMEDAGSITNIVILDACRDNPFERSWRRSTHGMGLAFMTAPAGSLISYATSPGTTASDGTGKNGLFTTALLEYIDDPGLSVLEMFQKVRTYVRENSNGEQIPWESTSLEGNFYFKLNQK